MLPFFTLHTVHLETGDTGRQGPQLLPSDATEPTAVFAELLQLSVDDAESAVPGDGMPLPFAGNPLPTAVVPASVDLPAPTGSHPTLTAANAGVEAAPVAMAARATLTGQAPMPNGVPSTNAAAPLPAQPAPSRTELAPPTLQSAGQAPAPPADAGPGNTRPAPADLSPLPSQRRDFANAEHLPRVAPHAGPPIPTRSRPAEANPATRPVADVMRPLIEPGRDAAARRDTAPVLPLSRDASPREHADMAPGRAPQPVAADLRPAAVMPAQAAPMAAAPAPAGGEPSVMPQATPATPTAMPLAPTPTAPPAESAAPAPQLHSTINVAVQQPAWGEQLGERVQLMANSRLQNAEIRVTPAELGPVRVQVAVDDGNATVTFHAPHALTREAIEQAMPRLRELLNDSGLTLQQASVSGDDAHEGSHQAGDGTRDAKADPVAARDEAIGGDVNPADDAPGPARRTDSLVDTFA